jgi:maltooligosyltrehalose trehalohydrolase
LQVGAVLLLTSPFTPMLWMGEEWAASTRWPFFTSHPEPELAARTGPGRIEEFRRYGWDVAAMPDPQDPATYRSAILDWSEVSAPCHAAMLDLYRRLIALRVAEPDLRDAHLDRVHVTLDEDAGWLAVHRGVFRVVANLAERPQVVAVPARTVVLSTGRAEIVAGGVALAPEAAAITR